MIHKQCLLNTLLIKESVIELMKALFARVALVRMAIEMHQTGNLHLYKRCARWKDITFKQQ